jgi:hypothetical protein
LPAAEDAPIYTRATAYWALYPGFPGGRYHVLYDGSGSIDYGLAARRIAAESVPGRDLIEIGPDPPVQPGVVERGERVRRIGHAASARPRRAAFQ